MSTRVNVPVPKHPMEQSVRRVGTVSLLFALLSAAAFYFGATGAGLGLVALAALYAWIAYRSGGNAHGVVLHNLAFGRATQGLLDEAEALSAQIPERIRTRGSLARAQGLLHALIAFQRGRLEEGVVQATRAIDTKESSFGFAATPQYTASGLGLRALLRASLGQEAEALEDIARAEQSKGLTPVTWARCRLAKAILASKDEGRREELVLVLREGRRGVEYLGPRERVLFRALERLVRIDARAAYREPGKRVEQAEAEGLSDWVSRIVPAAGAFVPADLDAAPERAPPSEEPMRARPAATQETAAANMAAVRKTTVTKRPVFKRLAIWFALVLVCGSIYALFGSSASSDSYASAPAVDAAYVAPAFLSWLPMALVGFLVLVIIWRVRAQRKAAEELAQVAMLRIRGEEELYARKLDSLAVTKVATVAASALFARGVLAETAGRFDAALVDVDAAMSKLHVSHATKVAAHDLLLPSIVSTRAFLLAMLGRTAEAEGEHAALASDYASFPFAVGANLRIRVALALREGDEGKARQIARERTMDMPLALRDEVLYDLLDLAGTINPSRDEVARISEEFARAPELSHWVDKVAPGLRARALGTAGTRVSAEVSPAQDEDEADEPGPLATQRGAV